MIDELLYDHACVDKTRDEEAYITNFIWIPAYTSDLSLLLPMSFSSQVKNIRYCFHFKKLHILNPSQAPNGWDLVDLQHGRPIPATDLIFVGKIQKKLTVSATMFGQTF